MPAAKRAHISRFQMKTAYFIIQLLHGVSRLPAWINNPLDALAGLAVILAVVLGFYIVRERE
jgi:hypothetical protein